MDFFDRLTVLMKERGLTHRMLENALGISNGSVSKWTKSTPNVKTLKKLENYFGVSVDYLMTGKETNAPFSDKNAELVAKIRNDAELSSALQKYFELSDVKKKHVIELINLL